MWHRILYLTRVFTEQGVFSTSGNPELPKVPRSQYPLGVDLVALSGAVMKLLPWLPVRPSVRPPHSLSHPHLPCRAALTVTRDGCQALRSVYSVNDGKHLFLLIMVVSGLQ